MMVMTIDDDDKRNSFFDDFLLQSRLQMSLSLDGGNQHPPHQGKMMMNMMMMTMMMPIKMRMTVMLMIMMTMIMMNLVLVVIKTAIILIMFIYDCLARIVIIQYCIYIWNFVFY